MTPPFVKMPQAHEVFWIEYGPEEWAMWQRQVRELLSTSHIQKIIEEWPKTVSHGNVTRWALEVFCPLNHPEIPGDVSEQVWGSLSPHQKQFVQQNFDVWSRCMRDRTFLEQERAKQNEIVLRLLPLDYLAKHFAFDPDIIQIKFDLDPAFNLTLPRALKKISVSHHVVEVVEVSSYLERIMNRLELEPKAVINRLPQMIAHLTQHPESRYHVDTMNFMNLITKVFHKTKSHDVKAECWAVLKDVACTYWTPDQQIEYLGKDFSLCPIKDWKVWMMPEWHPLRVPENMGDLIRSQWIAAQLEDRLRPVQPSSPLQGRGKSRL